MLKDLSDRDIAGEMQQPSGNVPLYLVAGEAKRRADLRQRFKAEQSGPPPTSTVQEDLLNSIMASQMPATGIAQGIQPQQMPMAPPPQQMAMAPQPQQMPAIEPTGEAPMEQIPQAQGIMAGQQGGMAQGFAGGGLVREDRKYQTAGGVLPFGSGLGKGTFIPNPRGNLGGMTLDTAAGPYVRLLGETDAQYRLRLEGNDLDFRPAVDNTDLVAPGAILETTQPVIPYGGEGLSDYERAMTGNPLRSEFLDTSKLRGGSEVFPDRTQSIDDLARVKLLEDNKALSKTRGKLTKRQLATKLEPGTGEIPQRGTATFDPTEFKAGDAPTAAKLNAIKTAGQMGAGTELDTSLDQAVRKETILAKLRGEAPKPYDVMRNALIERRAALAEDKKSNISQTLMDLGGRMMAGKSQYGLTNIGEAVSPALKAAQERQSGQSAREDALMASEMGIISGERTMDQDLQRQADTLVGYEQKKQDNINTEIVRKNAEARTVYLDNVRDKGIEQARDELIATTTNTFAKYNDTRQLNIQKTIYDREFNNYKVEDQALDNAFQNGVITDQKDYQRRKDNLKQEIQINAITRQSINDAQNQLNRKEDQFSKVDAKKGDQEFTRERDRLKEEAAGSRLDKQIAAKKNLKETDTKIKSMNTKSKIVRDAWGKAQRLFLGDEGASLPGSDDMAGWSKLGKLYQGFLDDSGYPENVQLALVANKIATLRGGSRGKTKGKNVTRPKAQSNIKNVTPEQRRPFGL